MKWRIKNFEGVDIPESSARFLVEEGIDESRFVYHGELFEGFVVRDGLYCIGVLACHNLVVNPKGELWILSYKSRNETDLHEEDALVASSLRSFVEINENLCAFDFSSITSAQELLNEISKADKSAAQSEFWRSFAAFSMTF